MKKNILFLMLFASVSASALAMKRDRDLDLNQELFDSLDFCGCRVGGLLDLGADINARDEYNSTPLIVAVIKEYPSIINQLLERGADVNLRGDRGRTALMHAVEIGRHDIVELLVKYGAHAYIEDDRGWTALMYAAFGNEHLIAAFLLKQGVHAGEQPGTLDAKGDSALRIAAGHGCTATAALLLRYGAHVGTVGNRGWTPLGLAAAFGHRETAVLLIKHGADIELPGYCGRAALANAARWGNDVVVDLLLEIGSNSNARDDDNLTPLHLAIKHNKSDALVQRLLTWVPDETIDQMLQSRKRRVRLLIESQRFDANLAAQMIPQFDELIMHQHMAHLECDEIVQPILKNYDLAMLQTAIKANVRSRLGMDPM